MVPARRRRGRRDRVGAVLAGKSVTTSMPTARPARQGRQTRSTPSSPNTSCTRATACGVRTTATLPAGAFGPSVGANGSHADGRLSPEQARRPGSDERRIRARYLGRRCRRLPEDPEIASRALAVSVEEARAFVVEAPVKHADETGWREARRRAWLWTVVTATVFMIHTRRNAVAARAILGRAHGVLVSDRHGAYNWWPAVKHQFCWAHLIRDFVKIAERRGDSERIGNALLAEAERMFGWWHRVRDGTLKRSTFIVYMRSVQRRVGLLLDEGAAAPHFKTSKTCAKLLKRVDALWTFLYVEDVEPTNNTAERAVRHGVLCRKTSYGTHSEVAASSNASSPSTRPSVRSDATSAATQRPPLRPARTRAHRRSEGRQCTLRRCPQEPVRPPTGCGHPESRSGSAERARRVTHGDHADFNLFLL